MRAKEKFLVKERTCFLAKDRKERARSELHRSHLSGIPFVFTRPNVEVEIGYTKCNNFFYQGCLFCLETQSVDTMVSARATSKNI